MFYNRLEGKANRRSGKLFPFVKLVEIHGGVITQRKMTVLQIRKGNRDNLGISSHVSP